MKAGNSAGEKRGILTLPNILTLLRVILIPVFVWMVVQKRPRDAFYVFLLAGITDILDGFAARTWRQRTKTGTILDPAADKLLLCTSFILLTFRSFSFPHSIPFWLTASVIGRDIIIALGATLIILIRPETSFSASPLGKTSTVFQALTVLLVLFFNAFEVTSVSLRLIFWLTLLATLVSGLHYIYVGSHILFKERKS